MKREAQVGQIGERERERERERGRVAYLDSRLGVSGSYRPKPTVQRQPKTFATSLGLGEWLGKGVMLNVQLRGDLFLWSSSAEAIPRPQPLAHRLHSKPQTLRRPGLRAASCHSGVSQNGCVRLDPQMVGCLRVPF